MLFTYSRGSPGPFCWEKVSADRCGANVAVGLRVVPGPGRCEWQSRAISCCAAITTRVRVGVSRVGVACRPWSPPCVGVLGGMLTHSLSSEEGFDGRACMVGLMARVRARHAEGSLLPFILFFAGVEPAGGNGRLVGWDVPGPGRCEWRSREESHGGAITTRVRVGVSRVGVAIRPWSPPCVAVLGVGC